MGHLSGKNLTSLNKPKTAFFFLLLNQFQLITVSKQKNVAFSRVIKIHTEGS